MKDKKKKSWKLPIIIIGAIVAVVISGVFAFNSIPNKAISYEEQITTAQSEIKIQEKRRADLIPNLVDCVKACDKHEYETLVAVIKERGIVSDSSVEEIKTMINAVTEQYPQLESSKNYKKITNELTITENIIANTRTNYNTWVTRYNSYCKRFPIRQILSIMGYEKNEFKKLNFDVSDDAPTNLFNN